MMHFFVLAAGVQSFGRHKDDRKQSASSSHRGRHCCECCLLPNCGWVMLPSLNLPLLINHLFYGECNEEEYNVGLLSLQKLWKFLILFFFCWFCVCLLLKKKHVLFWDKITISRVYWDTWHHLEFMSNHAWCCLILCWTYTPIQII